MNISKKQFLSNVSDYCGFYSDVNEQGAVHFERFLREPVCPTITRWLEEWVAVFNATNTFKVALYPEPTGTWSNGYRIQRIVERSTPVYPQIDDDEEYTLTAEEMEYAGGASKASEVEVEEEPGSPYGSLTPELAHQIVAGYLVGK